MNGGSSSSWSSVTFWYAVTRDRRRLLHILRNKKKTIRARQTQNHRRDRKKREKDAHERRDGGDRESHKDEAEDDGHLARRQEARHGGDPLRVRVDKVEFAVWQLRHARQVVRVEAVLLEALRADGRARRGRVDVVPRAIDGNALHALAKVRVGGVRVGHEAADGVCVDLVE